MRFLFFSFLLLMSPALPAQVFMRAFDNAAALSMGGANIAYPGMEAGLSNESLTGFGEKTGVYLGSAMPYGIPDWQTVHFQGFIKPGTYDGLGLEVLHSGIEAYGEQQFRLLYGRRMGERFYIGGSAAFLRVSAQEYGSANGFTFGVGLLANLLPNLWLGARIHNPFQNKVGDYAAEGGVRMGVAWQTSGIFTLLAEVEKSLERSAQIKTGIEYRPAEVLAIRTGVRTGGAARIGFGAGLRFKNGLVFDIGSEWHPSLGITPSAMFAWRK